MLPDEVRERLHKQWGWFTAAGLCLVVFGALALLLAGLATLATVITFGALLFVAGVTQVVHAVATFKNKTAVCEAVIGALYLFAGSTLMMHPIFGALTITMVAGAVFVVAGIVKIVLANRYHEFGFTRYMTANGIVSILLGGVLLFSLPGSALWALGTFVGVNLVFDGCSWMALGLALHHLFPIDKQSTIQA